MKLINLKLIAVAFLLTSCAQKSTIWKGTWESSQYPLVMGTLNVELPARLKPQQEFQTPVIISYSTNSLYRPNETINVDFEVKINTEGSSGGSGINKDMAITFKGIPEVGQTITYTAIVKKNDDMISGQYTSVMPEDKGIFSIQKQ